mmetsp:Transcript_18747/g.29263  ORF Transcript_18747/g.29263 Transcript_18747/m.29263 type:complete len:164 (+) Transcript_18747:2712-3203(+)
MNISNNIEKNIPIKIISVNCTNKIEKNEQPYNFIINYEVSTSSGNNFFVIFKYLDADSNYEEEVILEKFSLSLQKRGKYRVKMKVKSNKFLSKECETLMYNGALIISFFFSRTEFLRVGYYLNYEIQDKLSNVNGMYSVSHLDKNIVRILSKKPLITKFSRNI